MVRHSAIFSRAMLTVLLSLSGLSSHAGTLPVGTITASELVQRQRAYTAPFILDVRTPGEYASGHIKGALNVPHDELESRLDGLPKDKSAEIVVYCRSGKRAGIAEKTLVEKGYVNVRDLTGHWQGWGEPTRQP